MMPTSRLSPENEFTRSAIEVEKVLSAFAEPVNELFDRYINKNEAEKEAFVLALVAQAVLNHKRSLLAGNP